ncbi:MAG TPA: hypothetical protein VHI13_06170 [Candidatus Kapabacteria bacterium]|nr:hypothetical protein [Candidatus Kapabacteria bacterium]
MNRYVISSLLACALLTIAVALAPVSARAQQDPNCCDYMVNATGIPATCFPVVLVTSWAGGLNSTVTLTSPAFFPEHIPFPCPPAPAFLSATVTSVGGCCIRPVSFFCGGCLFIQLVRC